MNLLVKAGLGFFLVLLILTGCESAPENNIERIVWELERGNYSEAENIADDYRNADSLSPEAHYCQALLYEYQGLEWNALISLLDASPRGSGFLPAMEKFTRLAIKLNYFENGQLMNRILLNKYPENSKYNLDAAKLFMRQNIFDSAQFHIDEAAAKSADSKIVSLIKAELAIRSGDDQLIKNTLSQLSDLNCETEEQFRYLIDIYGYLNLSDSVLHYTRQLSQRNPDDIQWKLSLAKSLIHEHRPREALSLARELIDKYDNCGPAYIYAAYAERMMGDGRIAELTFNNFVEPYLNNPVAYEIKADYYYYFEDSANALSHLMIAFDLADRLTFPDDYLEHLFAPLINGLLLSNEVAEAHSRFMIFADVFNNLPDINFYKAHFMHVSDEHGDSAAMVVDDSISLNMDNPEWLEPAAEYFIRLHKFDEAKRLYQRLIEFPDFKPDYFRELAGIYLKQKDYDNAIGLFEHIPFRMKNDLKYLELQLKTYKKASNWDKAKSVAEILYNRSGEYVPYLTSLSEIYLELGLSERAYALFNDFTERYPEDSESYFLKAKFEFDQDMFDSAHDNLQKALEIDTANGQAIDLLGALYLNQGQTDSAMICFEKVVDMNFLGGYAYYNLTKHYLERGENLQRAESYARYSLRHYHDKRAAYILIGKVYFALEKYKLARTNFYNGTRSFPGDAELNFLLGKTYAKLENSIEARKYLQTALQLDLQSPLKEEAQKLMNEL